MVRAAVEARAPRRTVAATAAAVASALFGAGAARRLATTVEEPDDANDGRAPASRRRRGHRGGRRRRSQDAVGSQVVKETLEQKADVQMDAACGALASEVAVSTAGVANVLRADAAVFMSEDDGSLPREDAAEREALVDAILRLPSDPTARRQRLVVALNAFTAARCAAGVEAAVAKQDSLEALADIREAAGIQSARGAEELRGREGG